MFKGVIQYFLKYCQICQYNNTVTTVFSFIFHYIRCGEGHNISAQ